MELLLSLVSLIKPFYLYVNFDYVVTVFGDWIKSDLTQQSARLCLLHQRQT